MQQAFSSLTTSAESQVDSKSTPNRIVYNVRSPKVSQISIDCLRELPGDYGIRVIQLDDLASINGGQFSSCFRFVLLSIEAGLPIERSVYQAVDQLSRMGFKIICYGAHIDQMLLSEKCRLLLAGTLSILDSSSLEFGEQLRQLFVQLLTADANRRAEEANLKLHMKKHGMVGESSAMLGIWRWLIRVGPLSSLPILITGETGTGKDLLVNALWQLDPERCKGPFVVLNCSAVNPSLIESELFGHKRGAFTGAERDREGLFRSASGGVLFLDEIGDLDPGLQAKLLRVLQENRVLGVGQDREVPIKTRVVAATNRNLREMVRQKKFRADLFHRLDILSVHVPPLRQRPDDLRPLVEHFLRKYRSLGKGHQLSVQLEVIEALSQITLPGNARQLENIVRQILVTKDSDEPVRLSDLTPDIWRELSTRQIGSDETDEHYENRLSVDVDATEVVRGPLVHILNSNGWNLSQSMEYCERLLVNFALKRNHGKQSQTSKLLGITPRTLYSKIRKYDLRVDAK